MNYLRSVRCTTASLLIFCFISLAAGQAGETKTGKAQFAPSALVSPVVFDHANVNCADLNALHVNGSGDSRFSHIIEDFEMKLDFGTPNGTFPFTSGGGRTVVGPQYPFRTVTVASSGSTVSSWSSTMTVTAVILKVGNTSYAYSYKPFKFGDTDLITGVQQSISHLTFCFSEPTGVLAGDASLNGRVIAASGMGISKAQLVLINGATGESKITTTNLFGYYSFQDLDTNELYILNVSHRSFTFGEKQRVITPADNMTDLNFIAEP